MQMAHLQLVSLLPITAVAIICACSGTSTPAASPSAASSTVLPTADVVQTAIARGVQATLAARPTDVVAVKPAAATPSNVPAVATATRAPAGVPATPTPFKFLTPTPSKP